MSGSGEKRRVRTKVKRRVRRGPSETVIRLLIGIPLVAVIGAFLFMDPPFQGTEPLPLEGREVRLNDQLFDLTPNTWVRLHVGLTGAWRGSGPAGVAFDGRRNKIFVFGSNVGEGDWDNVVHEFDPVILQWFSHERAARRASYRKDRDGWPVAGEERLQPWAMQVYDGLLYDPRLDALVVTARPKRNPALRWVGGIERHPVWIYRLADRQWRPMDPGEAAVVSHGGGSAYDAARDALLIYNRTGIWEMGAERTNWSHASSETHHMGRQNLVYDSRRGRFVVFGGGGDDRKLWTYVPGEQVGATGRWKGVTPAGDGCLSQGWVAADFDSDNAVFLLVTAGNGQQPAVAKVEGEEADAKQPQVQSAPATCIYDPEGNRFLKLPEQPPAPRVEKVLVYDPVYKLFFLMGRDEQERPAVWALRLELPALESADIPDVQKET
ncbi:MAG: hypothetical protein D6720_05115 [Gammaproteobacteria bacterium]|nr:MAG: hypothetical protein D6720_05115 [Gammaproteobacteria bacterium]